MSLGQVSEGDLRLALRIYRVDPEAFQDAVFDRLKVAERPIADDPFAQLSPLLRSAAAFLPVAILAGCKAAPAASKVVPITGAYKLLSYLAFPAITIFVLFGATVLSIAKIRSLRDANGSEILEQNALHEATGLWWRRHKWGAFAVFAASLISSLVGATWLMFLVYIISFGVLLFVLGSLSKLGLANRNVIGRSCLLGLMFLGQLAMLPGIGNQHIHFIDQSLVAAVLLGGTLLLSLISVNSLIGWSHPKLTSRIAQRNAAYSRRLACGFSTVLLVLLMAFLMHPILWPATPSRMQRYVESFDQARFKSASWSRWEIVARWAVDSKLSLDLSKPQRLLAEAISESQDGLMLGIAFRQGLVRADHAGLSEFYEQQRTHLFRDPETMRILSLEHQDWIIYAAVGKSDLSSQQRDYLEQRLLATMQDLFADPYVVLKTPLRVTQLLELIDRPINREQYRADIHNLLHAFHSQSSGGFLSAGGFKAYRIQSAESWFGTPGSLEATSTAVELMEIYGVPEDLDLDWVRSFLKPSVYRFSDDKWIAAATLDRLNHLPGVRRPTWLEFLYYERSLIAALVLVGLCIYATLSAPRIQESHMPA